MNTINGRWSFTEDFGFGKDEGFAEFKQDDENITGVLVFRYSITCHLPITHFSGKT